MMVTETGRSYDRLVTRTARGGASGPAMDAVQVAPPVPGSGPVEADQACPAGAGRRGPAARLPAGVTARAAAWQARYAALSPRGKSVAQDTALALALALLNLL